MHTENLIQRKQEITQEIQELQKQLKALPDGKLICTKNGKYAKWYISKDGKYSYIPKEQKSFAEQLALKAYLIHHIQDLKNERDAINAYLKKYDPSHLRVHDLLSKQSYQPILSTLFKPLSRELREWSKEAYERNTSHPENLIHKSISGNVLRSKSEAMIDMLLYRAKLPYRYECYLNLGGTSFYPDFTIRHPSNGDTYYWEHFGMMDNPFYVQKYLRKMQIYLENGIIPDINLITTFETRDHPLTLDKVQKEISNYFT